MEAELIDKHPYTDEVTLSDGNVVRMPFHLTGGTTAQVLGLIDAAMARRFVNNHEFEPIRMPGGNGYGMGLLMLQYITESTAGPYNETVNFIFVKRKNAPDLNLPEISGDESLADLQKLLLEALAAVSGANEEKLADGKPCDYGVYAQFLELDNQLAVDAGLEIWGFPKILSRVTYDISDETFSVKVADLDGARNVFRMSYRRDFSTAFPFEAKSDVILPDDYNPHRDRMSQAPGISSVKPGTDAHAMLFDGEFEIGNSRSLTAQALRMTDFQPVTILELTELRSVGFHCFAGQPAAE